jgi:hypothetical protein
MHRGSRARSLTIGTLAIGSLEFKRLAIGGICLLAMTASVHAQAMRAVDAPNSDAGSSNGGASNTAAFNPYDPQWALGMPFGFSASSMTPGIDRQALTMKLGSGTLGLYSASNNPDYGAHAIGSSGNFFDPLPFSTISPRGAWFSSLDNSAWRSSVVGSYKSNPNDALLSGLYTTASFGVTSFKTGPAGLPGLTNFTNPGNDATAVTATAGVGYQITPQITIEGSVGFTQMQGSNFR